MVFISHGGVLAGSLFLSTMDTRCRFAHTEREHASIDAAERMGNVANTARVRNNAVPPQGAAQAKARPYYAQNKG